MTKTEWLVAGGIVTGIVAYNAARRIRDERLRRSPVKPYRPIMSAEAHRYMENARRTGRW